MFRNVLKPTKPPLHPNNVVALALPSPDEKGCIFAGMNLVCPNQRDALVELLTSKESATHISCRELIIRKTRSVIQQIAALRRKNCCSLKQIARFFRNMGTPLTESERSIVEHVNQILQLEVEITALLTVEVNAIHAFANKGIFAIHFRPEYKNDESRFCLRFDAATDTEVICDTRTIIRYMQSQV
jgi:hypothetical protein